MYGGCPRAYWKTQYVGNDGPCAIQSAGICGSWAGFGAGADEYCSTNRGWSGKPAGKNGFARRNQALRSGSVWNRRETSFLGQTDAKCFAPAYARDVARPEIHAQVPYGNQPVVWVQQSQHGHFRAEKSGIVANDGFPSSDGRIGSECERASLPAGKSNPACALSEGNIGLKKLRSTYGTGVFLMVFTGFS